jgi:type IV secretion system protein VirB5
MKTPGLRLLRVAACVLLIGAFANGHAQWAVIDASNLRQSMQQYVQMVEQVNQLKAQLAQLKDQYRAVTGSYGIGSLLQEETLAAGSIVPGSWQEVVRLQQGGKYKTKMDYYEGLMKTVDPALFEKNATRSAGAYKLSYDNTRAAFAVTDATYESVETHRRNIEQLVRRIDTTQNIKEAADLNNRLISENAMLQIAIARLAAVQGNLSASAQNDRIQSQAARTEMLRFDSNYQYRVRRP